MNPKAILAFSVMLCACVCASAQDAAGVAAITVKMNGPGIKKSGVYDLKQNATITDAIAIAGGGVQSKGFDDGADFNHVRVIRDGKSVIVNVNKIRQHAAADFKLQAGDVVTVPEIIF